MKSLANFRDEVEDAIYTVLNVQSVRARATGGVWNTQVPKEIKPPWVEFQTFSKTDDYPTYTIRGVSGLYRILAVSDSPYPKEATEIDSLVDAVMQNAALSMSSYSLLWCRRESDFSDNPNREGSMWTRQGGLWRIEADES